MNSPTRSKTSLALLVGYLATLAAIVMFVPQNVEGQQPRAAGVVCGQSVAITGNTAATASLVAPVAGKRIYVCAFTLTAAGTTTATLQSGTGSTCGTGTVNLTGALALGANQSAPFTGVIAGINDGRLCWVNSGAVQVSGVLSYTQVPY